MNWGADAAAQLRPNLEALESRLEAIHHQLLGYVGKITFDPQYQSEIADLRARWSSLPDRPPRTLAANLAYQPPIPIQGGGRANYRVLGGELERFLIDFGLFMRKWRLGQMITWDLPMPQGPLEFVPLGLLLRNLGPDEPATTIPSFHDVPSNIDLRKQFRDQQRRVAIDDGVEMAHPVTDASSRDGHASQYESAFRMWLLERG